MKKQAFIAFREKTTWKNIRSPAKTRESFATKVFEGRINGRKKGEERPMDCRKSKKR